MNEVTNFIKKFHGSEEVFTSGACYWFAKILKLRFVEGGIVYDPVQGHFAYRLNGRVYDVTGEIDSMRYEVWKSYARQDSLERARIKKYCIEMKEVN